MASDSPSGRGDRRDSGGAARRTTHREERARRAAARAERARLAAAEAEAEAAASAPAPLVRDAVAFAPTPAPSGFTAASAGAAEARADGATAPVAAPVAGQRALDGAPAVAALPAFVAPGGRRRARRAGADTWLWPLVGIIAVVLLSAWVISEATRPPEKSHAVAAAAASASLPVGAMDHLDPPTPYFARYRSLALRLPIAPESITTLAFHQASNPLAMHMTSLVREQSLGKAIKYSKAREAARKTGKSQPASMTVQTEDGVWTGRIIRLWRSNRRGQPDSAADVGAKSGTPVRSPVDGVVTVAKSYKLYNKYPDVEIHIAPTNAPGYEIILLHMTDPQVRVGDSVVAGVTRLAKVRAVAKYAPLQLSTYSADPGNHVHMQVNRLEKTTSTATAAATSATSGDTTGRAVDSD